MRIGVYWYWLDGNISKEGVIKDLQSMKDVGIGRAYIGDIGGEGPRNGPVVFQSEEWSFDTGKSGSIRLKLDTPMTGRASHARRRTAG